MFETVQTAPPDPILGLTEAYNHDPNPDKINLSVGVYKDAQGRTPILETVTEAERRLLDAEASKAYKPIGGDPAYGGLVQPLLLGADHPVIADRRAATAHTPGGTGALRIAGEYLRRVHGASAIWVSDPTWANHAPVFSAAGLEINKYPYLDPETNDLDFHAMIEAIEKVPAGGVVLLHGACHNPTGLDPAVDQWERLGEVLAERGLSPLLDFAYQGFADGIAEDAAGLRALLEKVEELLICSSFSKNFGLYNERVGALTVVARTPDAAGAVFSQLKAVIRANYSNPPAHGGAIVTTVLGDADLREQWEGEVAAMRERINGVRQLFADTLAARDTGRDFSFITRQRGMFSLSGLTRQQVDALRDRHSVYIVGSGRINVAGMTAGNMGRLCDAIADVL